MEDLYISGNVGFEQTCHQLGLDLNLMLPHQHSEIHTPVYNSLVRPGQPTLVRLWQRGGPYPMPPFPAPNGAL